MAYYAICKKRCELKFLLFHVLSLQEIIDYVTGTDKSYLLT